MVIDSKVINDKVGWGLNVKNKFQDLRRLSIRLATVMFMGTPCIRTPPVQKSNKILKKNYLMLIIELVLNHAKQRRLVPRV